MQAKLLSIEGDTYGGITLVARDRHIKLTPGQDLLKDKEAVPWKGNYWLQKYWKNYLLRRSKICYTARFINFVAMVVRSVFSCGTSNVGSNVPALPI